MENSSLATKNIETFILSNMLKSLRFYVAVNRGLQKWTVYSLFTQTTISPTPRLAHRK